MLCSQAEQLFDQYDTDKSGRITAHEFLSRARSNDHFAEKG